MSIDDYIFLYPGVFCPPTYGHLEIVKKACLLFNHVNIICSVNPIKKEVLFTPDECRELWKFYDLPDNSSVFTYDNFIKSGNLIGRRFHTVMIRGLRNSDELTDEITTVESAYRDNKIIHVHYIIAERGKETISSTLVRKLAQDRKIIELEKYVCENVASRLIYKYVKNNSMG